jgi:hypothetical protein
MEAMPATMGVPETLVQTIPNTENNNENENTTPPDEDAPTVTLTGVSSWQSTNATASASCDDGSGSGCDAASKKYKYYASALSCSTTYGDYTDSATITEHKFVCATTKDNSGNAGFTTTAVEFKVDKTAPETLTINKNGWYSVATDVSITASDADSDIASIKYKWDSDTACADGTVYSAAIAIPSGQHTLYVCAENNAGVQSTDNEVMGVDTSAPGGVTVSYTSGDYIVASVTVTKSGSDAESDIASSTIEYKEATFSNNSCGTYGNYNTATLSSNVFSGSSGKCYMFKAKYTNNAGLSSSNEGSTVMVDTTPPSGLSLSYTTGIS